MNLRVLILVCALAPAVASAQSITTEIRTAFDDEGVLEYRRGDQIIRNELGQETERILLDGWPKYDRLTPYYRYTFEYDAEGRLTVSNHHNKWPDSDVVSSRYLTEYLDEDRTVIFTNQRTPDLANYDRWIRTYDDQGRSVLSVQEHWRFGEWVSTGFINQYGHQIGSRMTVREYTDSTEVREDYWHNLDDWERSTRFETTRVETDRELIATVLRQVGEDGAWVNSSKRVISTRYDTNLTESATDRYDWVDGAWKLDSRTKQQASKDGPVEVEVAWEMQDDSWIPRSSISTQNGPWGPLRTTHFLWEDGGWKPEWMSEWRYDGSGKQVEYRYSWFVEGLWMLRNHTTWSYESALATYAEDRVEAPLDSFEISPNPVVDHVTLHFELDQLVPRQIAVFDVLGRRVHVQEWDPSNGRTGRVQVNMSRLSPGSYFVVLFGNGKNKSVPFIKL